MKNLREEFWYRYEVIVRWVRECWLSFMGIDRGFDCQSEVECDRKCVVQCSHCKEYYAPLESMRDENTI